MVSTTTRTQVTRRNFIRGLGLMSVASALAACTQTDGGAGTTDVAAPATPLLTIIHTNDVHGHVVAKQSKDGTWKGFSMAAVPALRRHWQDLGYEVLLVDAGDTMQGTPLVDTSRGALGIELMNACEYDLMTVGNHDFDWGPEATAANETSANFPFLSANVLRKGDGTVRFVPNTVVELADGTKVGFFGLTTPSTRSTTSPRNVADLDFLTGDDLIACAQEQVEDLHGQGAEIVVCVGHLGSVPIEGGSSKDVLEKVTGIDLFIDGHDHREVNEKVEETTLVEAGSYLSDIGVVAIDKGLPSAELVAAGTFDGIDETVQALVDKLDADTDVLLGEVMGVTPFFLNGRYDPELGCVETNLCDFCADAFRWKASYELGREIDAAIINDGGVRASIEAGDVTIKVIKTVLPFSDEIMVIDVTGAQLLEAIEAGCQSQDPNDQKPNLSAFPQVSGIVYTVDASVPYERGPLYPDSMFYSPAAIGARVTIQSVAGRAFDENETYSLAVSSFLAEGGDTYHAFREASEAAEPVTIGFDYGAFAQYLLEGCDGVVPDEYAEPQGRITVVGA